MKTPILKSLSAALLLFLFGGLNIAQAQSQEEPAPAEMIKQYLNLKDHFVASDAEAAQDRAKAFLETLPEPKSDLMKQVQSELKMIAENQDLKAQRSHFEALSGAFYELAKRADLEMTLYQQFCPMAGEDGAFWLSDKKEIRNPYYGDRMLKCGMVKETL